MLCSLRVLLVLVVLLRSGLPVPAVLVLVLVLVLFVIVVLAVLILTVLAVLVLIDWLVLAEAFCTAHGSGPTRASSSSIASITQNTRRAVLAKTATGAESGQTCRQISGRKDTRPKLFSPETSH